MQALQKIGAKRTVFLITHDLTEIEQADLILHIENGELIESGSHNELMAGGGTYAQLANSEIIRNGTYG